MRPVLFSVFGFDLQTYGLSKALAVWISALLLARGFLRLGLSRDRAYSLVIWAAMWGFFGSKAYYLLEHLDTLTMHDFGGTGFTWYGGLLAGTTAAVVLIRRWAPPWRQVAGAAAVPLSVGYAVGRVGCLLSGDGTYGRPTSLPWGMRFPYGVVSTQVPVHPGPLYEAVAALLIAGLLWWWGRHADGEAVFGGYLVLSGVARLLVELVRTNQPVLVGLTQPQLWAILSMLVGVVLLTRSALRSRPGGSGRIPHARSFGVPVHASPSSDLDRSDV
ncbi:MAG TPA: prolipoprotein diacylglyceryl transferase [Marmoricola sp.]|nr:prolipoprotein diacylglyceryl transferase [Marmoricola sp.]